MHYKRPSLPRGYFAGHFLGGRKLTQDGNSCISQDMLDDGFFQARSVVVEVEMVRLFVEAIFLEAIGIGEAAESAKIVGGERVLKFVGNGHERHGRDYSRRLARRLPRRERG